MLRRIGFWYVIACAVAGQAFGQDGPFLKETKVLGGRVVETFVPDPPNGPVPDPAFQQQPQAIAPQGQGFVPYQQQQQQIVVAPQMQMHQHQNGCGCPVCQRRILSQRTQERSKTIREITTVVVVEETHPTRVINTPVYTPPPQREYRPQCPPPRNPCPPQNPCGPYGRGQQFPQGGYAYQQPRSFNLGALLGFNSGVYLRTTGGNQGYGGYGGQPQPYAQSGYGGYGYASQPYGGR